MTAAKPKPRRKEPVAPEKTSETPTTSSSVPPFELQKLHKKALARLLQCHHDETALEYEVLSLEIGTAPKTKSWQSGAWKDLKRNGYIVRSAPQDKTWVLSPNGVALATSLASPEELAEFQLPTTNEELHRAIRKRLTKTSRKHPGSRIFDLLLRLRADDDRSSFLKAELASKLGTNPDSHGFYYGFKALENLKLVSVAGTLPKIEFLRRAENTMAHRKKRTANQPTTTPSIENETGTTVEGAKDTDTTETTAPRQDTKRKRKRSRKEEGAVKVEDPSAAATKDSNKAATKPVRIRGGPKLFRLSEKAFLTQTSTKE